MKLIEVSIHKYKSFSSTQKFEVAEDTTVLVGMNESGKTSALEALAKTNYFQDDEQFKFNLTHDYPRSEKKKIDKSGEDPKAITCRYELSKDLIDEIEAELGQGVLNFKSVEITYYYKSSRRTFSGVNANISVFIENKLKASGIKSDALAKRLGAVKSREDFDSVVKSYSDENYIQTLNEIEKYFAFKWNWENPIEEYIARLYIDKNLPKFLYYDEYFTLPSEISIEKLEQEQLDENDLKTAKAFFELADINTAELIKSNDFEDFIAELEATQEIISHELFTYWRTNKNLRISFAIQAKETSDNRGTRIVEHVLNIRVSNKGVSLPLRNRSKGFNWFFSFLVWFKKIQEDTSSKYILLLDEPGLNLHAAAQADLLRFFNDLSKDYQVIYTTHSPFMIDSLKLDKVRTVLETSDGSVISDSLQEKDPNTLFPLQAALGYDIAQNLFINEKNLLVEGVSDLLYLQTISSILQSKGMESLRPEITIVPTGGLDKVATFISLLRGSELEIVCLLDTFSDQKAKARMQKMISERIIHQTKVRFFNEFIPDLDEADIEDLFKVSDYLELFNNSFNGEYSALTEKDLKGKKTRIVQKIAESLGVDRFNHFRPANFLLGSDKKDKMLSDETLKNFERAISDINKLFSA